VCMCVVSIYTVQISQFNSRVQRNAIAFLGLTILMTELP
jgi:hypothetical protein